MPRPIHIFWHVYYGVKSSEYSVDIIERQWNQITNSGLLEECEKVHLCYLSEKGFPIAKIAHHPKVELTLCNPSGHEYETTSRLREWVRDNQDIDANILYLHNRGATRHPQAPSHTWTKTMEKFVVRGWANCVEKLKSHETVGCALLVHAEHRLGDKDLPNRGRNRDNVGLFSLSGRYIDNNRVDKLHYSGNIWWATSRFLKTRDVPSSKCRYGAGEDWILRKESPNDKRFSTVFQLPRNWDTYSRRIPDHVYE